MTGIDACHASAMDPPASVPIVGPTCVDVGGPFFDDLQVGERVDSAPGVTLTSGHAAAHQAILGDRLALCLDRTLSRSVLGASTPLAHPCLVCDVVIGQSTLLTQRVVANLFYRGLAFRRAPVIGDTLRTRTELVAMRQNPARPGRASTGLVVLRVCTTDQHERPVLDFHRCAMLPLRNPDAQTRHTAELPAIPETFDEDALRALAAGWDLTAFCAAVGGPRAGELAPGSIWSIAGGDLVSSAPELARLTINVAMAHHDAGASGNRLVYGGHTIGIAAAQATQALPSLLTILAWHSCEHLGPVHEGDTLRSTLELERLDPLEGTGALAHLRSRVRAVRPDGDTDVLDWRYVAALA